MKAEIIPKTGDKQKQNSVKTLLNRVAKQISFHKHKNNHQNSSKDIEERIAEWKRRFTAEDRVPGVIGIRNHGNTCFINAILQCLSYTDILAEYFVLDVYKGDLKRKKKLQASLTALYKRGTNGGTGNNGASDFCGRGEVTEQLATLLKSLWSLQYDPEISIRFKSLVEKHASQYKGGSQHDAQEFLLWLLYRVHEDLNVASRRRHRKASNANISTQNDAIPPDEVLAAESLANYMRSNNSFVMDVFQAQFRSSLTCPTCDKQSNTFDPFLCVSLPIPQKQLMPVFVTVLYIDQTPRQVKLGVTIGVHETIGDLRTMLSADTGIERDQILLVEIDDLTFRRTFKDSDPVTVIKEKPSACDLFCIEVLKHKEATEDDGAYVLITWVNVLKEGPIEKRFGSPYTIQVSREVLYQDLQKLLMKEMASILHDDILIANQKVPLFKMRIHDGLQEDSDSNVNYLDPEVELPMYTLAIEQAISLCSVQLQVVPHIKLTLEWDMPAKTQIIADDRNVVEEHASVKQVEKCPSEATVVSLQECFSLYTKAERLGDGDAWFCPHCKRKQEVMKEMGLWSVPDVLIIHLKRFRQTSNSSNKLSTLVDFPLEGYDMSPFVTNNSKCHELQDQEPQPPSGPEQDSHNYQNVLTSVLSSFKKDKVDNQTNPVQARPSNFVYDLYAVCNHHGDDLQGGHYTATCRNPTDGQWYSFDDMHTSKVDEADVVSQDAYILFYQKQTLAGSSSTSSASSSSSSCGAQEHWVYRMPDFNYKNKTSLTKAQQQANLRAVTTSSSFQRNDSKYATLPPTKSESSGDIKKVANAKISEETLQEKEESKSLGNEPLLEESSNPEDVSRPIDKNDVD